MNKKEIREVTVTYCDYCKKEIEPPYHSIEYKDGRKLDFCSDYIENGKNCLQKHQEEELHLLIKDEITPSSVYETKVYKMS